MGDVGKIKAKDAQTAIQEIVSRVPRTQSVRVTGLNIAGGYTTPGKWETWENKTEEATRPLYYLEAEAKTSA